MSAHPPGSPACGLPHELVTAIRDAYEPAGLTVSTPAVREAEGARYGACRLALDGRTIVFRVATTTPTKAGQFVTLWKRPTPEAAIAPLDGADGIATVVVSVSDATRRGLFVFPREALLRRGVMSRDKEGGKRALRVYPPWSRPAPPLAVRTQRWQQEYFVRVPLVDDADVRRIRRLMAA